MKGVAGFTSVAPYHAIEHENRALKVIGGIVGITKNEKALDKLFLIALEMTVECSTMISQEESSPD